MKRHPKSFWMDLVVELESGATVADVARRYRVRETTLRWWRSKLRHSGGSVPPRMVAVVMDAPGHVSVGGPGQQLEIAVGAVILRVDVGSDVAYVSALVRALGATC